MYFSSRLKKIFFILILVLLAGGIFGWANQASALESYDEYSQQNQDEATQKAIQKAATDYSESGSTDLRIPVVSGIISFILYVIMKLLSMLVQLGGNLVDISLNFSSFTQAPVVQAGWKITRDLCNMGFAAILLFMAFATVLGKETYGLKKLLPRLILVALLINFSLFFAGVIIDFSQILTHFFIDSVAGENGVAANLTNALSAQRIYDFLPNNSLGSIASNVVSFFLGTPLSIITEQMACCIILTITAFLFFALALFLFTRLITLWILLIFAPLAWLTYIVKIPGFADFSWDKWWEQFMKWTFFAPSYAFFIYLAIFVAQKLAEPNGNFLMPGDKSALAIQLATNTKGVFATSFFGKPQYLLQYIVVVAILLTGFATAQKVGGNVKIFGLGLAQKLAGAPKAIAKFGASKALQWAARGAKQTGPGTWARFRRGTSYLTPSTWRRAWKERQERKERQSYTLATGQQQDAINKVLSFSKEKTDYKMRAARKEMEDEEKTISSGNAEELFAGYERDKAGNKVFGMMGHILKAANPNDQNEFLRHMDEKYGTSYAMTSDGWASFVENEITPRAGEQIAYRFGHDVNRRMENNGQWVGRIFGADPLTGDYGIMKLREGQITQEMAERILNGQKNYENLSQELSGKSTAEIAQRLDAIREAINKKPWKERTEAERNLVGIAAREMSYPEWHKQDPQKKAYSTGRFSYIDEYYANANDVKNAKDYKSGVPLNKLTNPKFDHYGKLIMPNLAGETIDLGIAPITGERMMTDLKSGQAARTNAQAKSILIFRHPEEFKKLNAGAYDKIMSEVTDSTKDMAEPQIDDYITKATDGIPRLTETEFATIKKIIIEENAERKKKEEEGKKKKK